MIAGIQALLAETFHVPVEDIKEDLTFGDIPEWDSMGHMDLMITLEGRFGVEINADTISQLTSVQAIHTYLKNPWKNSPSSNFAGDSKEEGKS